MLSHCANSQCAKPFLRLGQGRLFLVEAESMLAPGCLTNTLLPYARRPPRHVERYWLCDQCAQSWTLVHDRQKGVGLIPLPSAPASDNSSFPGVRQSA